LSALLVAHPVESRLAAARALRALGLADGLAPLRQGLEDRSPEVRRAAAEGLLAIGGAASRPVLQARLSAEPDAAVRKALLDLLESP
jgi:HEAT repeat protein